MAYSSLVAIQDKLPDDTLLRLTDDENGNVIVIDRINSAISWADGWIDAYIGKRHTLPLKTVPMVLESISVDLAIYRLYLRRGNVPEDIEFAYKEAISFLKDVSTGKASLGEEDPDGTPASSEAPRITSDRRLFSRRGLREF
ncbi:DUF1320 domain-containing protein [Desulfosarcina sp. OttesenSCG-928-B08]|nr:DUF1320 domain-containing protein [Desulfosarcina sp. OttesenSCG-928-B08]